MIVSGWGLEKPVVKWLRKQGVTVREFTDGPARTPEVILVGKPDKSTREEWLGLARRVARGGVAVFLEPVAFKHGEDTTHWLPLAQKGKCIRIGDWLYHKECVAKRHPIFEGMQTGLLDWNDYDQAIGHDMFSGQEDPDEMICAAFYPCMLPWIAGTTYGSGAMVASYRLGAGRFILNTMNVCGQLDRNPAADRLLLNLVRYAQANRKTRAATVPAKLDRRLTTTIYPVR